MFGAWRANSTMCWPVPLPTSSTFPHLSFKNAARTDQIGRQLRWNAGASSRPSAGGADIIASCLSLPDQPAIDAEHIDQGDPYVLGHERIVGDPVASDDPGE